MKRKPKTAAQMSLALGLLSPCGPGGRNRPPGRLSVHIGFPRSERTKHRARKEVGVTRSLLALAPVLLWAATAAGQTVLLLDEPFDYASDAELEAVWDASGTSNPYYCLDVEIGNPDPSYAMPSPEASFQGRLARNLGSDYNPTDEHPLVLSFDFYLPEEGSGTWWSGARHYVELRGYSGDVYGSGDLQNLLAIGLYNNSGDEFHGEYYQGRVANGVSWITLDEEGSAPFRSPGWHKMEIWVWGASVEFWIDDELCEVEDRPHLPDPFGFDCVVLGSDLTANWHDSWVDNVRVSSFDIGACCLPGSTCEVMVMEDCQSAGGSYQGTGTDCDPNPCDCVGDLTTGDAYVPTDLFPLNGGFDCSRSISLIRRSEFSTCNPALITHLAIQVTTASSLPSFAIELRLKKTTATAVPYTWDASGTLVWSGSRVFSQTGWSVFDIEDFVWDSDNLLIKWQGVCASATPHPLFQRTIAPFWESQSAFWSDAGCPTTLVPYYDNRARYLLTFAAAPAGACCLADSICEVMTEDECLLAAGAYQGDGTDCAPNPCVPSYVTIDWYAIGAGGVVFSVGGAMTSADGDVKLSSSIGRPDAGSVMTGGDITLTGGFWAGVAVSIAGDCDFDGDVDLNDFADFEVCLAGPGGGLPEPNCACFDCDDSGDVDLEDFAAFQQAFTGS